MLGYLPKWTVGNLGKSWWWKSRHASSHSLQLGSEVPEVGENIFLVLDVKDEKKIADKFGSMTETHLIFLYDIKCDGFKQL